MNINIQPIKSKSNTIETIMRGDISVIELFYLDLHNLLENGQTITNNTYYISDNNITTSNNYDATSDQIALAKSISKNRDIKTNIGCELALAEGIGSIINMNIAMQQLVENDTWLNAPLTAEEKVLFASSEGDDFAVWE